MTPALIAFLIILTIELSIILFLVYQIWQVRLTNRIKDILIANFEQTVKDAKEKEDILKDKLDKEDWSKDKENKDE